MSDIVFVLSSLAVLTLAGSCLIGLLPRSVLPQHRIAMAPAIGLGMAAIVSTLSYSYGLPRSTCLVFLLFTALLQGYRVATRLREGSVRLRSAQLQVVGALLIVMALLMAPRWIAGFQFSAVEGNPYDQLNYLSQTFVYDHFDYQRIKELAPADALKGEFMVHASQGLASRPAVSLLFGIALQTGIVDVLRAEYAFRITLELISMLVLYLVLANVFGCSRPFSLLTSGTYIVSFYGQYIFGIDAWSELAGTPVGLLALCAVILSSDLVIREQLTTAEALRLGAFLTVIGAAAIYLYPEGAFSYVAVGMGTVIISLLPWASRLPRPRLSLRPLLTYCWFLLAILTACIPVWRSTIYFAVTQALFGATEHVDWWNLFDMYLFGRDQQLHPGYGSLYQLLSAPIEFLAGLTGLFSVTPSIGMPRPVRLYTLIVLAAFLFILYSQTIRQIVSSVWTGLDLGRKRLVVGCVLACLYPLPFLLIGSYWSAGKAFSMITPLLFILLVLPILERANRRASLIAWRTGPALALVCLFCAFGAGRALSATRVASLARVDPFLLISQWRTLSMANYLDAAVRFPDLGRCGSIDLNVPEPLLDAYYQLYLADHNFPWRSVRPISGYYGIGPDVGLQPPRDGHGDCLLTSTDALPGYRSVFSLKR